MTLKWKSVSMIVGTYGLCAVLNFALHRYSFPNNGLLAAMVSGIVMLVMLLLLLQLIIIRPIERLANSIPPAEDERRGVNGMQLLLSDEIGRLAIEFCRLQQQLRKSNDKLEQRVTDRTSELLKTNHDLQQEVERMNQEKYATKQSYMELFRLIETINLPIFGVNNEGMFNEWNQRMSMLTGYNREEIMGKKAADILLADGERTFFETILTDASKGIVPGPFELTFRNQDGERKSILLTVASRQNTAGKIVGVIGAGQEITSIIAGREQLAIQLENRNRELDIANNELTRVASTQEKFLANISHRLCTPLNSILGFGDLLGGQFYGKLNAKQDEYVRRIDESGRQLFFLISDLLDITRIDSNTLTLNVVQIEPEEIFRTAYEMMADRFKKNEIELRLEIEKNLPKINADSVRSRQIVLNLLANALKYTPPKGMVIIAVEKENDFQIRCQISDTGIGIAAGEKGKIFCEFYQAPRPGGGSFHGAGIGLAVSRRLVELQGGGIGVESRPGDGSTFWFTLGICPEKENRDGKEEKPVPAINRLPARCSFRGRILVVEDNDSSLIMICALLRTRGYEADVARDGKEAVEKACALKPDLILMDIRMPVMDGIEATRQLRAMPEFSATPIIAVTAGVDPWSWEQLLEAGCSERLAKPIASNELFLMLNRYLNPTRLGERPQHSIEICADSIAA